jgi:putative membrane protein
MDTTSRRLVIALAVLLAIVILGPLAGWATMGGHMGGWGMMGPWMGGFGGDGTIERTSGWVWGLTMLLGMLSMVAFWTALIVGVLLLVRWIGGSGTTATRTEATGGENSFELLRRRYASGEITQDEYEHMRRVLEQSERRAA